MRAESGVCCERLFGTLSVCRYICRIKALCFLLCCSQKVAKTDLYNERKREGRKEEGEIEKAACSAGRGAYAGGSVWSAGVGAYASGGGANASGAGACCERLCGTFSVILPYLLCQIAGLLFVL